MPTYVYRCGKCAEHLEVFQSFSEEPLTRHGRCGGKLVKVLSPVGIVLKGSGFYRNDSRASARGRGAAKPAESTSEAPAPATAAEKSAADAASKSEPAPRAPAADRAKKKTA